MTITSGSIILVLIIVNCSSATPVGLSVQTGWDDC